MTRSLVPSCGGREDGRNFRNCFSVAEFKGIKKMGDWVMEAARRRDRVQQLEDVAYWERRAQTVSLGQGRNILEHGFGMLNTR